MRGLLLKDLLNLKKQIKIFLIYLFFFIALAAFSHNFSTASGIIVVLCSILPVTAMSYDERAKWDKYALTMPVSRGDMVISKYLLGLILGAGALLLNLTIGLLFMFASYQEVIITSLVLFEVGLFMIALLLPFMFKYGVEKSRLIMLLIFFIPTGLIVLLAQSGLKPPSEATLHMLAWASPFLVLAIFIASLFISLHVYAQKQF